MTFHTSEFFTLISEGGRTFTRIAGPSGTMHWGGMGQVQKAGGVFKGAPAMHTATRSAQALISSALLKPTETIKISRIPRHSIQLTSHRN